MSPTTATNAPATDEIFPDLDQVQQHFLALNRSGEVREVRILGYIPPSGYGEPATASGYFDNAESLRDALRGIGSQHASGIYITQNPVDPDLLARARNRLQRRPKHATTDADISRLTHLTLDWDPVRKAGISATDAELALALAQRDAFIQFVMAELSWPEPVISMMSGNGGQATWRIDLPADTEGRALVAAVLDAASVLFSTDAVSVDTTLANPSRIVKLSGTVAAKGDSLPHRPHRQARSEFQPDAGIVSAEHLRALVALAPTPDPQTRSPNGRSPSVGAGTPYDVPALLQAVGIDFQAHDKGWGIVYELDRCLSSDDHNDGAAIYQFPNGAVAYKCFHSSCANVTWQDVKPRLGITAGPSGYTGVRSEERAAGPEPATCNERVWPTLDDAALYGLSGVVVRAIAPHTEGDPVALLVDFQTMFGSAAGRSPHARVGATRHHANMYAILVGETARARKGTAHAESKGVVERADPDWKARVQGGLSSGEGLIYAVRDPIWKPDSKGEMTLVDPGVDDKRLLAVESEFSSVLRVAGRDGNILSELMRRGWDGDDLRTLTRSAPLSATAPHISLLGHITAKELLRELNDTYQANGWANRHLFICVRRSKELPHGGELPDAEVAALANRVRTALACARRTGVVRRDAETDRAWEGVYSTLTAARPGMLGAILARAEAHVLRLSLVYALLDLSPEIRLPHLQAALALWQYAEDSARFIFGDATGDPVADQILAALRRSGRMTQTQISDLFARNQKAGRIELALTTLLTGELVRTWQGESTGGRAPTYWEAL